MENLYNDINIKVDDLITAFSNSYNFKRYNELRNKMLKNDYINKTIKEIKNIQKGMVRKVYNKEDISLDEVEINKRLENLNDIPLYVEYNKYHDLVNNNIIMINDKLNCYIENLCK